ncbi:MAG TPA: hypothetical protein DDW52_30320 [Planctomycetaceae bacterium]|nr:hypothetical protein [Planctomycetaceae bacterium]
MAIGLVIGMTIADAPAFRDDAPSGHVVAQPPIDLSGTACEDEALAYAYALAQHEAAVDLLNDAYDDLAACMGGDPEEPEEPYQLSEERASQIAVMRSVLER